MSFKQWLKDNNQSIDMTGDAWQIHEQADAYANSQVRKMFDQLADKLQTESSVGSLAINFDGHAWEVGDMYGYGVPTFDGKDLDSLFLFLKEQP